MAASGKGRPPLGGDLARSLLGVERSAVPLPKLPFACGGPRSYIVCALVASRVLWGRATILNGVPMRQTYSETPRIADLVERLESRQEHPPLVPAGLADREVDRILRSTTLEGLFDGQRVLSEDFARAVQSGLHLWNDNLSASHGLAQTVETETGSYWHALMHRREPDYANSKYWWRRVGEHVLFPGVCGSALKVLLDTPGGWSETVRRSLEAEGWSPCDFVDWCEGCASGSLPEVRPLLEQIQLEEIRLLLVYSYEHATA